MTLCMGVSNATFTYVKIVVVLMYSIERGRIEALEGEIQPSDWLELSEKQCARTSARLVAAERIVSALVLAPSQVP